MQTVQIAVIKRCSTTAEVALGVLGVVDIQIEPEELHQDVLDSPC